MDVPRRYRRRLPVIEAIRYTEANSDYVLGWCGGRLAERDGAPVIITADAIPPARPGDYLIRETLPDGTVRHYPMDPRLFEFGWEPAPPTW